MKKIKRSFQWNKITPLSKYLAMALFVALPLLGFYFGTQYQQKISGPNLPIMIEKCELGLVPKENYLEMYIVKPRDTILSIAKNQLGDVSRANELIELNKEKYPSISIKTPFIEQGWSIYLPPKSVGATSGTIAAIKGEVIQKDGKYWRIKTRELNSQDGDFPLVIDNSTKMVGLQTLKPGVCIKVIYDVNKPVGSTALLITEQNK